MLEFGFHGTNRSWEDTFVHFKLAPAPWVSDSSPPQGWLSESTAMDEKRDKIWGISLYVGNSPLTFVSDF